MVARLAHAVEDDVALEEVAPSESVVHVDTSSRPVVAHIIDDACVGRELVRVARRLLRVNARLVRVVARDDVAVGIPDNCHGGEKEK